MKRASPMILFLSASDNIVDLVANLIVLFARLIPSYLASHVLAISPLFASDS